MYHEISRRELLQLLMTCITLPQQNGQPNPTDVSKTNPPTPETYRRLSQAVAKNLNEQILRLWFPQSVDKEKGGFFQNYGQDWSRFGPNSKGLVYQSRLTWIASTIAHRFPSRRAEYIEYAQQGRAFLTDHLWDAQNGGMFWSLDENGHPVGDGEKHAYGNAFSIYALAACYQATHDPRALDLAKRAFTWLDNHAHDAKNGGYYEALTREGKPILDGPGNDFIGTRLGLKSMNTHIHILEALTGLYEVWHDPTVHARLAEVYAIVRDRIATSDGRLEMFFNPDWKPVSKEDSYGHDIETAYLLEEAASVLGQEHDPKLLKLTRRIVDHTMQYAWDDTNGGFYDSGPNNQPATRRVKIWWVQAEAVNALLLMHRHYGHETLRYWNTFLRQWAFIQNHQVDAEHGGWYSTISQDGSPFTFASKSDEWTDPYHQGRAMLNLLAGLKKLAG
jgi:mannobiose 2-epimerase